MLRLIPRLRNLLPAAPPGTREPVPEGVRVAILPFTVESDSPALALTGAGVPDSLAAGLKYVPGLIVIDRWMIERLLKEDHLGPRDLVEAETAAAVGSMLGARQVVTGAIGDADEGLALAARVIDAASTAVSAELRFAGDNLFQLHLQLAEALLQACSVSPTPAERAEMHRILLASGNMATYDSYLRGRRAYLQFTPFGYATAVRSYQRGLEMEPQYPLAVAGLEETMAMWRHHKFYTGDETFEEEFERAEELYARSVAALKTEKSRPAPRTQAKAAAPEEAARTGESYYALWIASGNADDPDHEFIGKALAGAPSLLGARLDRGLALEQRGRYAEAADDYRAARDAHPAAEEARVHLGRCLTRLGQHAEAVTQFRAVLRLNARSVDALLGLGGALVAGGSHEEALAVYREAIRLRPQQSLAYVGLGEALEGLGRVGEAAEEYRRALRFNPTDPDLHCRLGRVYRDLGRLPDALREWESALILDPEHVQARQLLAGRPAR